MERLHNYRILIVLTVVIGLIIISHVEFRPSALFRPHPFVQVFSHTSAHP